MRLPLVGVAILIGMSGTAAAKLPPLRDPVFLNIGFVCQWQTVCIEKQQSAMKKALNYVKRFDPPRWKIEQCNRNASRARDRVDWVGYNHCIRNPKLRHTSARTRR